MSHRPRIEELITTASVELDNAWVYLWLDDEREREPLMSAYNAGRLALATIRWAVGCLG